MSYNSLSLYIDFFLLFVFIDQGLQSVVDFLLLHFGFVGVNDQVVDDSRILFHIHIPHVVLGLIHGVDGCYIHLGLLQLHFLVQQGLPAKVVALGLSQMYVKLLLNSSRLLHLHSGFFLLPRL